SREVKIPKSLILRKAMIPVRNSHWLVYILQSKKDGFLYTGCTQDLKKRINQHQNKEVFSTKNRLPIKVIYYEYCLDKKDAYNREKYLKSGMGHRYVKNRLKNYFTST
ncbi:MAG: putative endonuclease, partial [Patescibacteria group bacterium]|nr:putative endonuclease [Patescibacteria group bacterium]